MITGGSWRGLNNGISHHTKSTRSHIIQTHKIHHVTQTHKIHQVIYHTQNPRHTHKKSTTSHNIHQVTQTQNPPEVRLCHCSVNLKNQCLLLLSQTLKPTLLQSKYTQPAVPNSQVGWWSQGEPTWGHRWGWSLHQDPSPGPTTWR